MAILRTVAAVIVGYLAMFFTVMVTFTGAYLAMGASGAFEEGTYEVSTAWIIASSVLGLIAAVIGGVVCALIAKKGSKAPMVLAGLVFVLGVLLAIPVITADKDAAPATRGPEVGNMEAMQNARQPVAIALLNPVVGAVGVLIGARMSGKRRTKA